ncbi:hypothetical protein BAUCODRAFT_39725 [Baudoinia panamericana UAMH 10762]|uniref:Uncharacterized protein n=1 Tax=Baudoinia panamericana (strain UAMH 10762) TaxID=717646 RepID=M2M311_BAUPA|nr:uncharacterized protein BAUCODRAFT_39725 [Baudoinia panamericana UAMH 10762]EMC90921.1 hypothetical protein BAUCODRAFT_39725 [Baudoinia panamericana UAMH 10762]
MPVETRSQARAARRGGNTAYVLISRAECADEAVEDHTRDDDIDSPPRNLNTARKNEVAPIDGSSSNHGAASEGESILLNTGRAQSWPLASRTPSYRGRASSLPRPVAARSISSSTNSRSSGSPAPPDSERSDYSERTHYLDDSDRSHAENGDLAPDTPSPLFSAYAALLLLIVVYAFTCAFPVRARNTSVAPPCHVIGNPNYVASCAGMDVSMSLLSGVVRNAPQLLSGSFFQTADIGMHSLCPSGKLTGDAFCEWIYSDEVQAARLELELAYRKLHGRTVLEKEILFRDSSVLKSVSRISNRRHWVQQAVDQKAPRLVRQLYSIFGLSLSLQRMQNNLSAAWYAVLQDIRSELSLMKTLAWDIRHHAIRCRTAANTLLTLSAARTGLRDTTVDPKMNTVLKYVSHASQEAHMVQGATYAFGASLEALEAILDCFERELRRSAPTNESDDMPWNATTAFIALSDYAFAKLVPDLFPRLQANVFRLSIKQWALEEWGHCLPLQSKIPLTPAEVTTGPALDGGLGCPTCPSRFLRKWYSALPNAWHPLRDEMLHHDVPVWPGLFFARRFVWQSVYVPGGPPKMTKVPTTAEEWSMHIRAPVCFDLTKAVDPNNGEQDLADAVVGRECGAVGGVALDQWFRNAGYERRKSSAADSYNGSDSSGVFVLYI